MWMIAWVLGASGSELDEAGRHLAGWRDVVAPDDHFAQDDIPARVYYPALAEGEGADPDGGRYPLVALLHGWLGSASDLDLMGAHIASWGFVVVMPDTEGELFPETDHYTNDGVSLLRWADAQDTVAGSFLAGAVEDGPWAAVGHSMGGGTLFDMIVIEPRLDIIVPLEPADTSAASHTFLQTWTGSALMVAASHDPLVPEAVVRGWWMDARSASRAVLAYIEGGGHNGVLDETDPGGLLPHDEQRRLHQRLAAGFLRAERYGEEDRFGDLIGRGMATEPLRAAAHCVDPALWLYEDLSGTHVGMCGATGRWAGIASNTSLGTTPTPLGTLDLANVGVSVVAIERTATGIVEGEVFSGSGLYLQGVSAGASTRVLPLP